MAHVQQLAFIDAVRRVFPHYFVDTRTIEIGSLDVNGSIRKHFSGGTYTGVDVGDGPGVDDARPGQLVDYPTHSFDVAVSCECFEHNPFWVETFANMLRVTRPGGLLIMSCASVGRAEHGTTRSTVGESPLTTGLGWEYYGNISRTRFLRSIQMEWWFSDYCTATNWASMDLYFVGILKPANQSQQMAELQRELSSMCRPTKSLRALSTWAMGTVGGDRGVGILRAVSRVAGVGSRRSMNARDGSHAQPPTR